MEQIERITIRVDPIMLKSIDDLRRNEDDVPTRSEMVRRLIVDAVDKRRLTSLARQKGVKP